MTDILAEIAEDIGIHAAGSERSQQVETGASQVFGCRAAAMYRLRRTPSDPHVSWQALVGSAVDERLGRLRAHRGVSAQRRLPYGGVTATVDEIDGAVLRDWKTKDDAAAIAKVRRDGPSRQHVAQVQLGAAAAIEAGHHIERVEVVYLPRGGTLDAAWAWSDVVRREVADEAVAWAQAVDTLAVSNADPRDYRDMPVFWCYAYCPFADTCRGQLVTGDEDDLGPEVEQIADAYVQARSAVEIAKKDQDFLRSLLDGVKGRAGAFRIRWQGGAEKTADDVAAMKAAYRERGEAIPQKPTVTSRSLYVERAK